MSSTLNSHTESGNMCPDCGSDHLVLDNRIGEKVCSQCGFVLGDIFFDRKPEWRSFNFQEREKRSRMGLPTSLAVADKGLQTNLGNIYRDTRGKISSERQWQLLRISKWQKRVSGSSNLRNLNKAMSILATLVSHLKIRRNVQEQTAMFYRKAIKKKLVKGRSIEEMIAACLYAACRFTKTQRTLNEIAMHTSGDKKDLSRTYRFIYNELNLSVPRPNARNRIPKIASKARVPQKTQNHAIEILKTAENEKITAGKHPDGLAAAALYIACRQDNAHVTQKEIAYAAGVSEVTVRNRYNSLVNDLDICL
jgi:transcription initiation factor TFIIB